MKNFALLAIITAIAAMSSGCSVMPTARKILGKPLNVAGIVERYPSGEHPWKPEVMTMALGETVTVSRGASL